MFPLARAADREAQRPATFEVADPLAAAELDVAALALDGVRSLRVEGAPALDDQHAAATVALVRLLREAASVGLPVEWSGAFGTGLDLTALVHLAPPAPSGDEAPEISRWRERHRPGLCYYRLGPGFVFVKDVRGAGDGARFRVDLDDPAATLGAVEAVVDVSTADASTLESLDALDREHLVLKLGGHATLLPYRMRRWPVPALAV